ncbi:TPA: hypothetical protein DDW35_09205, partial [Candidatus Sumerlaeota bacterium]|nr:hypothetical protein [Candidatus Sumerlaeota bacterium]
MRQEPHKRLKNLWVGIILAGLLLSGIACEKKSESSDQEKTAVTARATSTPKPAATPSVLTKRGPNESFYTIQQSLDVGGTFYLYASIKDLLKKKVQIFEPIVKQTGMPPEALKMYTAVNQVIDHLGLYGVQDIGISTMRDGDLNRTKAFIHLPEGRAKGIPSIWGGDAHPLQMLDRAPDSTQVLITGDVDANAVWDLFRTMVQDIGGEKTLTQMDLNLNQWGMQSSINIPALVPTLGGEVAFLMDQTPSLKMVIPTNSGVPLSIDAPRLALMVRLQKDDLYESIRISLSKTGKARSETVEGKLRMALLVVPFQPLWPVSPVLATDGEYMYISTHAEYVKTLSAGAPQKSLRQSEEFQKLITGLPTDANGCFFVSERLKKTYMETVKSLVAANTPNPANGGPDMAQMLQKIFDQQGPVSGSVGLRVNQANGILFVTRSQADMAEFIPSAMAGVVGMVVAVTLPEYMHAQTQLQQAQMQVFQNKLDTQAAQ